MGTLTECDDQGNWSLKGVSWKDLYIGKTITREIQEKLYGALWKLMQYERIGLDPEQVEQMFEAFGIADDYVSVGWVKDIIRNNMNDGWIPVEKKMPEEEGIYLVTLKEGEKVTLLGYGNCRRDVLGKPIGFGWYYCATATYFSEDAVIA